MVLTNDEKAKPILDKIKNDLIEKEKKEILEKENALLKKINKLEGYLDNLKKSLDNLQTKLIEYKLVNNKLIQKILPFLNHPLKIKIKYTKPIFRKKKINNEGNVIIEEEEKYFPIRGGCFPSINHMIKLNEIEEFNKQSYEEFIKEKTIKKNNKNYYIVKTELRNGFVYGSTLNYLSKPIDFNETILKICSILPKDDLKKLPPKIKNLTDKSGNSLGHYKIMMSSSFEGIEINNIQPEDLNKINNFSESPELFSVLTGNVKLIKKLISSPYSNFRMKTEGGLSPLNLALINDSRSIVKILLEKNNIKKNGNLNSANELGYTPLHLAIMCNNDKAVKSLLENGADISLPTRKLDCSPIHLMSIYTRNEIISDILKDKSSIAYKQFIQNINIKRVDNKTALHFICSNSILGTKLLLSSGAKIEEKDIYGNTPIKYAFYSGRFDIYNLFNEKKKQKIDLKDELEVIKLKSSSGNLLLEEKEEDKELIPINLFNYEELINFFEKNKIENVTILDKKELNNIEIYNLIEISCKNRNIELLKILNELTPLKDFIIGPYLGKYGLFSWFKEVSNFGINIFSKSENILNNKDIIDFCIINSDIELLKEIFQFDYNTSEELITNKISYIFCESLVNNKNELIHELMKELKNKKYENFQISLEPLIKNKNTTLSMLKNAITNYPKVNSLSISLENIMKYSRPTILEYFLNIKKYAEDIKLLIKKTGLDNIRFDNLLILYKNFPFLLKDNFENDFDDKLIQIENLLSEKNIKGIIVNTYKRELTEKLKDFNIGLIKLPINNTYLPHLIIKNGNIWAFELLKDKYENIFFYDDNNKTCFHYLKSERNYDKVEFNDLKEIIKFFGNKNGSILKVIDIFVEQNKDIGINEELIDFLLKSPILENIFFDYNEDYNTIFHIIANMRISKKSLSLIMKKLEDLKNIDINLFKNILNLQNIHGDSFLMIFLKNQNYMISIEILEKFYDDIQINSHNYLGNSILHILFMDKNFEKVSNDIYNLEKIYELILKILNKNKKLILSKNREFNSPFILAANSACNMALTIMTEFYDIKYLEQINEFSTVLHQACISNNLNTVRYLIELHHYDPNIQLKKRGNNSLYGLAEGSTPLHAAAVVSSIEIFEYLILHGGDPFIQNNYGNDAFDIAFESGKNSFLKYIFNLKSSLRYGGNDKYLLSLVKNTNKDSIKFLYQYEKMNTFENFNILDKDMNTLLILACIANNPEIIPTLLNIGLNPFAKNIDGFNCLHICAYLNCYCCAGIILSEFEGLEEKEKIKEILTTKNNNDETPLHIAIEKNHDDISLLFISYLLRNNIKLEMVINSNGLTPLQLAIKNHSYKIALIYIKYLNLNYLQILEIKNRFIDEAFKDFLFCYDSGLLRDDEKIIEEKFSNMDFYKSQKDKFNEKFKSRFKGEKEII